MPVVIDDYVPHVRPAVYPPSQGPPSAGGGAWTPPPGAIWHAGKPGSAGKAGRPAFTPDYIALYRQSPEYRSWLAQATGRRGQITGIRQQAIRELIRQYGGLPPGWKDAFGDIRPEDIAAAQANQFSTVNVLQHEYELGVESMRRQLAARGMLQSGELNVGQTQADYAKGQAEGQAFDAFTGRVGQAVSDWTTAEGDIAASENPILTATMPRIVEDNPADPGEAGVAPVAPTPGYWEFPKTAIPATRPPKTIYAGQPVARTRTAQPTTRTARRPIPTLRRQPA